MSGLYVTYGMFTCVLSLIGFNSVECVSRGVVHGEVECSVSDDRLVCKCTRDSLYAMCVPCAVYVVVCMRAVCLMGNTIHVYTIHHKICDVTHPYKYTHTITHFRGC